MSSPAATGGAGTVFDEHVDAYWLAQLLVGATPPVVLRGAVADVAFQTEHLGWHTDDFLITCEASDIIKNIEKGEVSAADIWSLH